MQSMHVLKQGSPLVILLIYGILAAAWSYNLYCSCANDWYDDEDLRLHTQALSAPVSDETNHKFTHGLGPWEAWESTGSSWAEQACVTLLQLQRWSELELNKAQVSWAGILPYAQQLLIDMYMFRCLAGCTCTAHSTTMRTAEARSNSTAELGDLLQRLFSKHSACIWDLLGQAVPKANRHQSQSGRAFALLCDAVCSHASLRSHTCASVRIFQVRINQESLTLWHRLVVSNHRDRGWHPSLRILPLWILSCWASIHAPLKQWVVNKADLADLSTGIFGIVGTAGPGH